VATPVQFFYEVSIELRNSWIACKQQKISDRTSLIAKKKNNMKKHFLKYGPKLPIYSDIITANLKVTSQMRTL